MTRVVIESPYAGNVRRNTTYSRRALRDCLDRGEAPYASHALYTLPGVLDDQDSEERELAIRAGFAWRGVAERTVVYIDYGVSDGMRLGINDSEAHEIPVEFRSIGRNPAPKRVDGAAHEPASHV